MKKYGFGADVGGTTIKMGLFEMDGTLVEKWEIPTDTTEKGAHILQDIAATVHGKMVENDLTKDMVEGIGIGVPGAVDKDGVSTVPLILAGISYRWLRNWAGCPV